MKTWNSYKEYVKNVDYEMGKEIQEMEEVAAIVSVMIKQRKNMGLSQRDLAGLCSIPQSSVARIESHKITPNLDTLLKILNPLGLKLIVLPIEQSKIVEL